jgi:IS5 family transposase
MAHRVRRTHQLLKRDFGLNRTRIDGLHGARTWIGHGIFVHNLVKIAGLIA